MEKEGNITKLNDISKEVDEGHQDLRRSKRLESIIQDQNDKVTVVKEENVPRQLRTRESPSSKEGEGNTIQDNSKKSPLPTGTKNHPINEITKPIRRTINVDKSLSVEPITITYIQV